MDQFGKIRASTQRETLKKSPRELPCPPAISIINPQSQMAAWKLPLPCQFSITYKRVGWFGDRTQCFRGKAKIIAKQLRLPIVLRDEMSLRSLSRPLQPTSKHTDACALLISQALVQNKVSLDLTKKIFDSLFPDSIKSLGPFLSSLTMMHNDVGSSNTHLFHPAHLTLSRHFAIASPVGFEHCE